MVQTMGKSLGSVSLHTNQRAKRMGLHGSPPKPLLPNHSILETVQHSDGVSPDGYAHPAGRSGGSVWARESQTTRVGHFLGLADAAA